MTAVTPTTHDRPDLAPAPGGDRFLAAGLFLMAATFGVLQVLAGTVIPPVLVPALIYAVLGALAMGRRARWLRITSVVLLALHLLTSIPFFASSLSHPESPASFLPDTFAGIIGLVLIAGTIATLRGAGSARGPIAAAGVVIAAIAVVVSVGAAANVDAADRQPGDVTMAVADASFPEQLEVASGGALWVDNRDLMHHTFTVEGTDIDEALPGRRAVRLDVGLPAGAYRFYCAVPGHEAMEGELVVR